MIMPKTPPPKNPSSKLATMLKITELPVTMKATAIATSGTGGTLGSWIGLLVAFDLMILAAGTLVYGYLLED